MGRVRSMNQLDRDGSTRRPFEVSSGIKCTQGGCRLKSFCATNPVAEVIVPSIDDVLVMAENTWHALDLSDGETLETWGFGPMKAFQIVESLGDSQALVFLVIQGGTRVVATEDRHPHVIFEPFEDAVKRGPWVIKMSTTTYVSFNILDGAFRPLIRCLSRVARQRFALILGAYRVAHFPISFFLRAIGSPSFKRHIKPVRKANPPLALSMSSTTSTPKSMDWCPPRSMKRRTKT